MSGDPDALVIGSGPNGLTAALRLCEAGLDVLVLEANAEPGGAVRSRALTRPGFVHDLGAAFFGFGPASPALKPLDLEGAGLRWCHAPVASAHPAPDGTCGSISMDRDAAAAQMGGLAEDGRAFNQLAAWFDEAGDAMLEMLLGPLPPIGAAFRFGLVNLLRFAEVGLSSGRAFSSRRFRSEAARRVLPGLALHTDIGPRDPMGAAVGFMLGMVASKHGFPVPAGGAGAITAAMLRRLAEAGGRIETEVHVDRIVEKRGEVVAVATSDGRQIRVGRCIVADVAAPRLYLDLLSGVTLPSHLLRAMRRFPVGFSTFKVDYALDGPVGFDHEDAAQAAVVHAGDSLDDLDRFVDEVRRGRLPDHPYLVMGQQSLADPSRAPAGQHTLWCYSRVPAQVPGGWREVGHRFADRIDDRIEGLAKGFKSRILERVITTPPDLEATNENLLDGDLGGGSAQIHHQLFFRPAFPYFRYRTPLRRLYLGSSYAHPGAGVHGACGRNAAEAALADLGAL
ncbi:MAG: NAD(P)/FAD-dependent oxidoreductase [Polyangiaceae bacterium]